MRDREGGREVGRESEGEREREKERESWRQPMGKWMVSLVDSHANSTSKRWHMWRIDLRFPLNSTPGCSCVFIQMLE